MANQGRPKRECDVCGKRKNHNNHVGSTWIHDFADPRKAQQLRRGSTVPAKSAEQAKTDREYAKFRAEQLELRPWCEIQLEEVHADRRPAVELSHILTRARAGWRREDLLDPANVKTSCADCHRWVESNRAEAARRGLLAHAWDELSGDEDEGA